MEVDDDDNSDADTLTGDSEEGSTPRASPTNIRFGSVSDLCCLSFVIANTSMCLCVCVCVCVCVTLCMCVCVCVCV